MNKALSALKIIALVITLIFFAIWASSRWIITYVANSQFEKDNSGMSLAIDSMSLNLFGPSLTMEDVSLSMPNDNYLRLSRLEIELQYLPLFFKEVTVETFQLDGLDVRYHLNESSNDTSKTQDKLENDPATIDDKDKVGGESTDTKELPAWTVIAQHMHINDIKIDANLAGKHIATKKTHIHLNNTEVNLEQSLLKTELDIALSFAATLANKERSENQTEHAQASAPTEIAVALEQFVFKTSITAKDFIDSPAALVENFQIQIQNIESNLPDYTANLTTFDFNFSKLSANNLLTMPELTLTPDLYLTIQNINAVHTPSNSIITDINQISLNQVGLNALLNGETPDIKVAFENFNIQDMLLLQYDPAYALTDSPKDDENKTDTQADQVTLFTMSDFNLNQLNTSVSDKGTNVELASVIFNELNVNALLHALPTFIANSGQETPEQQTTATDSTDKTASDNNASNVVASNDVASNDTAQQSADNTNDMVTASATEPKPSSLTYSIGEISHQQAINVHLKDSSVIPEFEQKLTIETLNVKQLASNFLNMEANIDATINDYAQLLIDINPNTVAKQKDNMLVDAKLSNFDLVSVSPYVKRAADMSIERGNVDLNSVLNINHKGWKGDIHLVLKSLGVTTVNTSPDVSLEDESVDFIPLNVLLDKISDSKGHLEIDLPIEGENGELSGVTTGIIRNVVEIITTEAAKSYLVQTFVPYSNIVSIAQYAGNKMFEINIEDLQFPVAQSELSEQDRKVFDAYAKLIKEQDSLVITVCPVSTWADLGITPQDGAPSSETNETEETKLTELQLSKLYELAKQREVFFKNQLIAQECRYEPLSILCDQNIKKHRPRWLFKFHNKRLVE